MMDKLRESDRAKREKEEGELVTRPDGSQVMRVRRRKRRSKQGHKTREVRRKRAGVIALIAGVILLGSLAATVMILLARFNSKGFRDELKERLLSATGAQTGITELSVTPIRARAKSMEFQWPGAGVVKSLKLKGLSAPLEPTSLVGADWNGEAVTIDSGSLLLGPPDGAVGRGVLEGGLPFDYTNYRCSNFEIAYGEDAGEPSIRITGSEVTMRPREEGGAQFLINGGRAAFGGWEQLRIDNGLAEMEEGTFRIVALRISPPGESGGEATLRSSRPMHANSPAELDLELTGYSLAHLLGSTATGLGRLFDGTIETAQERPGMVLADPAAPDSAFLEVEFSGNEGTIKNLMFLRVLGGIIRNSDYGEPVSGVVSGVVKHDRDGTHLRNFDFETKAFLKLQGNVDLNRDGSLSGALRVGVPQGVFLTASLERYHTIFSQPEAGYRWIMVNLFGTIDRPLDDFGRTVERAVNAGESQPGPDNLWEETFRRLTEEPEEEPDE